MLAIDHVLLAVDDLDAAGDRLLASTGLASAAGGRHRGHGTANRIVPLGDAYLELIAVVDAAEARTSPLGRYVDACSAGAAARTAAVCVRTDDLDAAAGRLGERAVAMERTDARGRLVAWRLVGLDRAIADGLPFLIQWWIPARRHPGRERVAHRAQPLGVSAIETSLDPATVEDWLGPNDLPFVHRPFVDRYGQVLVSTTDGVRAVPSGL